jgi:H+/gluconate symporter-like permease
MVVLGAIYIVYSQKRAVAKGEGFIAIPQDNLGESKIRVPVPNFFLSILPIFVVIAVVFFTRKALAAMTGVCLGLFAGCVIAFAVFWKRYPDKKAMINKGFSSSIMPLMSTAAILGYGSLVQASLAFQNVVAFAKSLTLNPYITTAIGVNIVAGVAGSSSGGERIFLEAMGQIMLNKGVPAEALHRIAAISSSGLDSLPHNGAVLAIMMVWGPITRKATKTSLS